MLFLGCMGKAINCILADKIYNQVLEHKAKLQKQDTEKNISLTEAVEDLLELGLKK